MTIRGKINENELPACGFCSQKVQPSCLRLAGVPRNYHPECWMKIEDQVEKRKLELSEEKKERENNPLLFSKVEKLEKEVANLRKSLSKN
jgi:hypothetical protein